MTNNSNISLSLAAMAFGLGLSSVALAIFSKGAQINSAVALSGISIILSSASILFQSADNRREIKSINDNLDYSERDRQFFENKMAHDKAISDMESSHKISAMSDSIDRRMDSMQNRINDLEAAFQNIISSMRENR